MIKDESGVPKGYGFVEFKTHDEALKALHRVNNSSKFFGPERRPIVEFAIDDVRALQLLEKRTQKNRDKQIRQREEPEEEEPDSEEVQKQAMKDVDSRRKERKLSAHQKRELKEKIHRREELKKAKRVRRTKRRSEREANAADDNVEIDAKRIMAMKEKREKKKQKQ